MGPDQRRADARPARPALVRLARLLDEWTHVPQRAQQKIQLAVMLYTSSVCAAMIIAALIRARFTRRS